MLPVKPFVDFIEKHQLFTGSNKLLAAVSGGMDSVLMCHLLKAAGYHFAMAHCNFQLRGDEALADQQFCKQLADNLEVEFHTIDFDTLTYAGFNKLSVQMAARELRYKWFEQLSRQHDYDAITLAHHKNDTIETILLNLTRGTGIAGLHGILPKNGNLVRPMLFLTREQIIETITINGLQYVEDSSNASVKYARNKIRHEVIPKLKELNSNLENTFERNLRHFKELEILFQQQLDMQRDMLFIQLGDEISVSIDGIRNLKPQHLLLYGLLQPYGFNETTVDDILASLDKHSGRVFQSLTHQITLDRDRFILSPLISASLQPVSFFKNEQEIVFGEHTLRVRESYTAEIVKNNPSVVSVAGEKLIYPLTLRTWQQSDYFYPLGMDSRKKLSDFFINQKVPLSQKNRIPLLVNGNGEVIWISGYRLDNRYKVSDNTKKVTIFELNKQ